MDRKDGSKKMNGKTEIQPISPEQRKKNNRRIKTRHARIDRETYK